MLIDWFTVAAQAINFLVLLALLRIFLYDRVLKAVHNRQQAVEGRFAEADQAKDEAEKRRREYEERQQKLQQDRQGMLDKAHQEAEARKEEMLETAKQEVEKKSQAWRDAVRRDREEFLRFLREMAAEQNLELVRRAVADLARVDVQQAAAETFVDKLQQLDAETLEALARAAEEGGLLVKSAEELDGDLKASITDALHAHVKAGVKVEFRTDPELVLGVAMMAGDVKVGWSLQRYLETLRQEFEEALARTASESEGEAAEPQEQEV